MKKSLFLAVFVLLASGFAQQTQTVKVDDRTTVTVTVKDDGVLVNWDCAESNMKYVKEYYRTNKFRWDFYKGETIDCYFSPHSPAKAKTVSYPAYRVMANPGKYFFRAFLAVSRNNPAVRHSVDLKDDRWTAEWFFPYSSLETFDFRDRKKVVTFYPGNNWTFKFLRRSQSSGKMAVTESPVIMVKIPAKVMEPYQSVIFATLDAPENKGKATGISGALRNLSAKEFVGKVNYYLHKDKEVTLANSHNIRIPAKGATRLGVPIALPELAVKFGVHIEILNAEGKVVRVSTVLPVENPWVDFK